MKEMQGKVIVITGGASGMGRTAAKKFLDNGGTVYLADINETRLKSVVEGLSQYGTVKPIVADVTKVADCENAINTIVKDAGRLDVLVNSAGVFKEGPTETNTEEMWNYMMNVNSKGTFFMCSRAIPELAKTKGVIVNVNSDAGVGGNPGNCIYNASKGAVSLITKSLALELAPQEITVNSICPCDVNTEMLQGQMRDSGIGQAYIDGLVSRYPAGDKARVIEPEEVVEVIYFLATNKCPALTGQLISLDWALNSGY